MDRDVLGCVIGESASAGIKMQPAILAGYRKVRLPHETYPLLIPEVDSRANGMLLHGLDKEALDKIVFFEGEEYELSPVAVKTEDGECREALFFDEGIMPPARTETWDFAEWRRLHKEYLIRQATAYMSWYGKLSAAEADVYWQNYSE